MDTRLVLRILVSVVVLGIYYVEKGQISRELPPEFTQGPEALTWLRKSKSESALASNRFGETRNAIQFVQGLYNAGAARVVIPLAAIESDKAETYSDSVLVSLPSDPAKRDRVWKLCAEELRRAGDHPPDSPAQDQVLLWWD